MVYLFPRGAGTNECFSHKAVDQSAERAIADIQVNPQVSSIDQSACENAINSAVLATMNAPDSSQGTRLKIWETWDTLPFFHSTHCIRR